MVMYLREKMIKCSNKELWYKKKNISKNTNILDKLPKEYIDYMNKEYGLFID